MVTTFSLAGIFCTKYSMAQGHRNYAKEGILLLLQACCFSERMGAQLLWSRCINTY